MKIYLMAAAAALLASAAQATPPAKDPVATAGAVAGAAAVAGVVNDSFNHTTKIDSSVKVTDNSIKNTNTALGGAGGDGVGIGVGLGGKGGQGVAITGPVTTSTSQGQDQAQKQQQGIYDSSITSASVTAPTTVAPEQSVTFEDRSVYEATKRAAASAYAAPQQIGGGVCAYTPASVAVQLPGFGGSGSGAKIDPGCETRATADMFARLGMNYEACLIMVSQSAAIEAGLGVSSCTRPAPQVVYVPAPAATPKPAVTMAPIPNPAVRNTCAADGDGECG